MALTRITNTVLEGDLEPETLRLTPSSAPAYQEGLIWYDQDNDALSYYNDISGSSMQIGFEQWVRVRNSTGSTITNGSAVVINGATGQTPTITLANASTHSADQVIGLVTADIANNATGHVTTFGLVRDINTSGFADGAVVYVSTVAGTLTTTPPVTPNAVIKIGICAHSHVTQGKILVTVDDAKVYSYADKTETLTNKTLTAPAINGGSASDLTSLTVDGNTTLGDATTDTVTVNGYMGVGTAADPQYGIRTGSAALTGTSQIGAGFFPVATSAATGAVRGISVTPGTAAAVFTVGECTGALFANASKGAGSTITNQRAVYILDQTQGTNNYGIESQVSSGSNKWNIYASGTASNYFAGNILSGTTTSTGNIGSEQKLALVAAGTGVFPGHAAVAYSGISATAASITDFKRSRGTVDGSFTVVASGDDLGYVRWWGADGAAFIRAAQISAQVDGTPGTNDMPGRLLFSTTADGASSPTERMRIDASGQVGIGLTPTARNNTRLQIVDGIGFPATQVASSDANTLDDYEEGTFTPTIVGSGTAGTGTYSTQTGRYTKIGNRVFADIFLVWSAHTGTGNMLIGGLPFTSGAASGGQMAYVTNMTITGQAFVQVNNAVSIAPVYSINNGTAAALALDTAATLFVELTYNV